MYATKIDLPESTRAKLVELLNARLAEAIDLQTQCKHAHWNVKGPNFYGLHKLFDEVNEDVEEYVDFIAERVAQLGGTVEGTARLAARRSGLPEYPPRLTSGRDHVGALAAVLAAFAKQTRAAVDAAESAHDTATADIFTEITRGLDQWLWMVEAHLQAEH